MTRLFGFFSPRPTRRVFALGGVLAIAFMTAGCFGKEPEQRKAFIAFLQSRVIDRPGLHIPIMSDKDVADFGPYADHYRILNGFHHRLDNNVSQDLRRAAQMGRPQSLEELRNQRALIPAMTDTMAKLKAELAEAEADADAAHAALNHPPDLKAVYDKAYERMVTRPARLFRELMPLIETTLPTIGALAAFLDDNRGTIELKGNQVAVKDEAVRARLAALIDEATKLAQAVTDGQRKLQAFATGR
jgi:hypothetical protein